MLERFLLFSRIVVFLLWNNVSFVSSTVQPHLGNLKSGVHTDFDIVSFVSDEKTDQSLYHYQVTGKYNSTGRPYSAFVAVFPPNRFSFFPPVADGCKMLVQPSISSVTSPYDCEYATNGAFFTWNMPSSGSLCIGNLVSDGKVWQLPTDGSGNGRANFGISSTKGEIVTGFIDSNTIQDKSFSQLITGWGWLVRNGVSNVNASQDLTYEPNGFTLEKAPRTAVGVFKNGTMILLEIDGEEDILYGPDLFETAELLVSLGVHTAVNIDGGGSSTSVLNGKVISQPTCNDTPEICERAVASFACVNHI
jgi:N-acetylglucosamine-1-phosphodiester alpha-N-acetylglucosaminidase